jgi:hypothetical protein
MMELASRLGVNSVFFGVALKAYVGTPNDVSAQMFLHGKFGNYSLKQPLLARLRGITRTFRRVRSSPRSSWN